MQSKVVTSRDINNKINNNFNSSVVALRAAFFLHVKRTVET